MTIGSLALWPYLVAPLKKIVQVSVRMGLPPTPTVFFLTQVHVRVLTNVLGKLFLHYELGIHNKKKIGFYKNVILNICLIFNTIDLNLNKVFKN